MFATHETGNSNRVHRMSEEVALVPPQEVRNLRELHRKEMNCQIVLDSWLERGWVDAYLLQLGGRVAGYGLVGNVGGKSKEIVVEFYVLPVDRGAALPLFRRLAAVSGAKSIEVQTNDRLLTLMLFDCAERIEVHSVLFEDGLTSALTVPDAIVRQPVQTDREHFGQHGLDQDPGWVLEVDGSMVATGGILCHYNPPYGDIYMSVAEAHRRRGYGSFLVQELKRICYEMGRIPAARCSPSNHTSRLTLQKAGMIPCARVLTGVILRDAQGPS